MRHLAAISLIALLGCSDASSTSDAGSDAPIADSTNDTGIADASSDTSDTGVPETSAEGGKKSYSTNFPGVENPISENGVWITGFAVGIDWNDVRKENGFAYGANVSAGYDDCIAHLKGFAPDQLAQATVHVAANYTPPSSHEIELLLRFQITPKNARGYEINCGWNGAYSQIVRWNGALNDFTYLNPTGPGFGALKEGDVIRATAIGNTITVYKNGNQVMQVSDPTWTDGNPGMAMFVRPGGTPKSYCFTQFSAGDL